MRYSGVSTRIAEAIETDGYILIGNCVVNAKQLNYSRAGLRVISVPRQPMLVSSTAIPSGTGCETS
jgi:hypothetical protein